MAHLPDPRADGAISGALIENHPAQVGCTSNEAMGRTQALAFVAPLVYFIFIILSTCDLISGSLPLPASSRPAELLGMAMF